MKGVMKGEECFYIVLTEKIKCDKISCADIMLVWLSWQSSSLVMSRSPVRIRPQAPQKTGSPHGRPCFFVFYLCLITSCIHRRKSCKKGGGCFQIDANAQSVRQNHKRKKEVELPHFAWKPYFLQGVLTGRFLYTVHDIISPVIKFYSELSTSSTDFSTPRKAA